MRIAIASSGLGHVARGVETWARDTADALAARGVDVVLFGARSEVALPCEALAKQGGRGAEVGLTCESLAQQGGDFRTVALPCMKRTSAAAQLLARAAPAWAWRWGLKNPYGWEQLSFWLRLAPELRRRGRDILHVQDPMLAFWCRSWRRRGWLRTKEILAHGTEEPPEFVRQFEFVQHLAPWHQAMAEEGLNRKAGKDEKDEKRIFPPDLPDSSC